MLSFVSFVIVIGVCVLVHEWGHYMTARMLGIQVHEFALGMGPLLKQIRREDPKTKSRMLWSLRVFPIGGFCRIAGMGEDAEDEPVIPGMGFNEQPGWKRFFVLLNGSLGNIALALLLTAIYLSGNGLLNTKDTKIGTLMEGFPAQQSGFQVGDRILEVNGRAVSGWGEMSRALRAAAKEGDVAFTVERGAGRLTITTAVPYSEQHRNPMLGVTPEVLRFGIVGAVGHAGGVIKDMTKLMLRGIWDWILQKQEVDVTGPVGIASMSGRAMREGAWSFLTFLALISLNLGLLNLFPFPALDGGRILFVFLEMLFRRRLPERVENWIHTTGLVVLLALMAFVTWQDIRNLFFAD